VPSPRKGIGGGRRVASNSGATVPDPLLVSDNEREGRATPGRKKRKKKMEDVEGTVDSTVTRGTSPRKGLWITQKRSVGAVTLKPPLLRNSKGGTCCLRPWLVLRAGAPADRRRDILLPLSHGPMEGGAGGERESPDSDLHRNKWGSGGSDTTFAPP